MRLALPALGLLALGAAIAATPASADGIKIGTLRCDVSGSLGLIISSSKSMDCVYRSGQGYRERYSGVIRSFGLDIGATQKGVLAWTVFAPTRGGPRGGLAGDYGGVSASATVGVGAGANALVGGMDRSITLQPFSVQAQTGLSLAAGVSSMTLAPE